ncbi:MAG: hypothetical protein LIO71_00400 [Ruminococcus sp.]|nr:hypothetical protein [Ruminococcus sp.]
MKRTLLIILSGIILLTSCGAKTDTTSDTSKDSLNINVGSSSANLGDSSLKFNDKISDYSISNFDFSAYFYDYYSNTVHEPTRNKYRGEILDENIKKQLWEMISNYEEGVPIEGGSVGGSDCAELYLTDKNTGKIYTIYFSIWYASPELEGGPMVISINGDYYGEITGDSDMFYSMIGEAIMKDENLISLGASNYQNSQTAVSNVDNQLTKGERRSEIVLISQYINWAEDYQNYGYFVTIYGDVYEFNFSDYQQQENMFPNEKIDFLSYLVDIMEVGKISRFEDVSNIIEYLENIENTYSWSSFDNACDMGQTTLYGVRPNENHSDMEIIKLYSYGNNIEILQDGNAIEICEFWLDDRFITIE